MADSLQQSELIWADIKNFSDVFHKSQQTRLFNMMELEFQLSMKASSGTKIPSKQLTFKC